MSDRKSKWKWVLAGAAGLLVPPGAAAQDVPNESGHVEKVVVTASKTGQEIRSINGSVSSVSGEDIDALGAQSAQDYLPTVPGVVFNAQQPGLSTITIRGVATSTSAANNSQNPTGSYINDVPLTDPFFTAGIPDIDAFDVRNIEVYRGPQGTLFGAASLGGAVNYIANRPSLDGFELRAETTQSAAAKSDDLSSSYKLMLNEPFGDRFAARVVGTYRRDAGYVDNAGTGVEDSNESTVSGGRAQFLFDAWEGGQFTWLTLYQKTKVDDFGYRDPDLGDLTKFTLVPDSAATDILLHSLRFDQGLGFADLTAIASYHRKTSDLSADVKRFAILGFDTPYVTDAFDTSGESYEVRLRSAESGWVDWLFGAMYSQTRFGGVETVFAANAGAVADALLGPGGAALATDGDSWGYSANRFSGVEEAIFGQATFNIAPKASATVGGRLFRTTSDTKGNGFGLLNILVGAPLVTDPPVVSQEEDGFSPTASVSYTFSDAVRVYASASKGFRFGGGNVNPDPSLPRVFGSDSLWNTEAGLRSDLFDGRVRFDATAYRIDWSNIPLTVVTATGTLGTVNAGDAEIDGVEIALDFYPTDELSFRNAITYTDATLTSVEPGVGLIFTVASGAKLPASSDWMVSNIVRYESTAPEHFFVQLAHRYASEAPALLQQFAPPGRNAKVGGYNLVDIRAGLIVAENLELNFFADNVFDERAVLSASYLNPPLANELQEYVARPRTFGLSVGWRM